MLLAMLDFQVYFVTHILVRIQWVRYCLLQAPRLGELKLKPLATLHLCWWMPVCKWLLKWMADLTKPPMISWLAVQGLVASIWPTDTYCMLPLELAGLCSILWATFSTSGGINVQPISGPYFGCRLKCHPWPMLMKFRQFHMVWTPDDALLSHFYKHSVCFSPHWF